MSKITYICISCGKVHYLEKGNPNRVECSECNHALLGAGNKRLPDITPEQHQTMVKNNTWNDYLIQNRGIMPYVRNLKQQIETQQNSNGLAPKCPTCGTTNIRRITGTGS